MAEIIVKLEEQAILSKDIEAILNAANNAISPISENTKEVFKEKLISYSLNNGLNITQVRSDLFTEIIKTKGLFTKKIIKTKLEENNILISTAAIDRNFVVFQKANIIKIAKSNIRNVANLYELRHGSE